MTGQDRMVVSYMHMQILFKKTTDTQRKRESAQENKTMRNKMTKMLNSIKLLNCGQCESNRLHKKNEVFFFLLLFPAKLHYNNDRSSSNPKVIVVWNEMNEARNIVEGEHKGWYSLLLWLLLLWFDLLFSFEFVDAWYVINVSSGSNWLVITSILPMECLKFSKKFFFPISEANLITYSSSFYRIHHRIRWLWKILIGQISPSYLSTHLCLLPSFSPSYAFTLSWFGLWHCYYTYSLRS